MFKGLFEVLRWLVCALLVVVAVMMLASLGDVFAMQQTIAEENDFDWKWLIAVVVIPLIGIYVTWKSRGK